MQSPGLNLGVGPLPKPFGAITGFSFIHHLLPMGASFSILLQEGRRVKSIFSELSSLSSGSSSCSLLRSSQFQEPPFPHPFPPRPPASPNMSLRVDPSHWSCSTPHTFQVRYIFPINIICT